MMDKWTSMEHWRNDRDTGTVKYMGKTFPSTALSTTNPSCTGPGLNPGLCSNRLATNHWSHGKAPNSQTAYLTSMLSIYIPHSSPLFCSLNLVAWMTDCLKDKYLEQLQIMENKNIPAAVYFHARLLDMYVTHKHLSCWFLQHQICCKWCFVRSREWSG